MNSPIKHEDLDMESYAAESTEAYENDNPLFRPYVGMVDDIEEEFEITRAKYSTSLDVRGYIPGKFKSNYTTLIHDCCYSFKSTILRLNINYHFLLYH